ncbi:MAG: pyrroline-5-carboxylate reductase [Emergencia sp.]
MNSKIVFCGGGNMAEGILRSLLSRDAADPADITVNELIPERCRYLSDTYGVAASPETEDAIRNADVIFIAVIPRHVPAVAATLKPLLKEGALVISIAAAVTLETLAKLLDSSVKIIRSTPNTLNQSGSGYSAVCPNGNCSEEDISLAVGLFSALGQVMMLREEMFNAFTCFSNVGPLWAYKMIEALTDAGVYVGFSREDARSIVIRNMIGAASVLELTGEHPAVKVDQMTSPGGVTIEALRALNAEGFSDALMSSVIAGFDKVNALE